MTTMGEFLDLLAKSNNISGRLFLEWACRKVDPDNLRQFRACPFCKNGVTGLLTVLIPTMAECITMHDDLELYRSESRGAHEFLQELHRLACDEGILIGIEEVDVPLTYTEMAVAAGVAKVTDGMVSLTEHGEAVARQVEEEISRAKEGPE